MAAHKFSGKTTTTYVIPAELADDTWRFTAKSRIDVTDGAGIKINAQDSRIIIEGRVEVDAGSYAIDIRELNTSIALTRGAIVSGVIACYEDYASIVNRGTIKETGGGYPAIQVLGDFATLHNYGAIRGHIEAVNNASQFFNEKSGMIIGGLRFQNDAGESTYTVNHGNIRADLAFQGSDGDDRLKNDGSITGNVSLGSGKDVADMRGGTLDGYIAGDGGDDILITDKAKNILREYNGQGEDIIKSTVSYKLDPTWYVERLELIGGKNINATGTERYEELWGNAGNNILNGRGGFDYFDGKAGNDLLKSANDGVENRFIFRTGYDRDTIQYFDVGVDNVYLGGWKAIDDFADLLSHARNRGDDVVISAGKDSLTIRDIHKAELQADDFGFLV